MIRRSRVLKVLSIFFPFKVHSHTSMTFQPNFINLFLLHYIIVHTTACKPKATTIDDEGKKK